MRITLTIRKRFEEQAAERFEAAKKAKRKLEGARATIVRFERELPKTVEKVVSAARTKAWYERFRWSRAPDSTLLVGGRDAGTNEVLLKRHLELDDLVVHTDDPGSPFVLIKGGAKLTEEKASAACAAAGQLCAAYSRAWKRGSSVSDAFWVTAEQVSKTANAGEYIGRGAFMIRGEKRPISAKVAIALGRLDDTPACGVSEIFSGIYALVVPGDEKSSDVAKKLVKRLGGVPDDWVPLIPPGGSVIQGWKRGSGVRAETSTGEGLSTNETGEELAAKPAAK